MGDVMNSSVALSLEEEILSWDKMKTRQQVEKALSAIHRVKDLFAEISLELQKVVGRTHKGGRGGTLPAVWALSEWRDLESVSLPFWSYVSPILRRFRYFIEYYEILK